MNFPDFKLPSLDAKRVKRWRKQAKQYTDRVKGYLPVIIAFGLGFLLGFVQDKQPASTGTPAGEDTAQVQEIDTAGAEEFADRIVEMLRRSQCSQIYSETSLGFRVNASEEQWLAQCTVAASVLKGEAAEVEAADSNTNDDVVEFSYKINAEDDKTYIILVQVVNRNGQWRLQGINSQVE